MLTYAGFWVALQYSVLNLWNFVWSKIIWFSCVGNTLLKTNLGNAALHYGSFAIDYSLFRSLFCIYMRKKNRVQPTVIFWWTKSGHTHLFTYCLFVFILQTRVVGTETRWPRKLKIFTIPVLYRKSLPHKSGVKLYPF